MSKFNIQLENGLTKIFIDGNELKGITEIEFYQNVKEGNSQELKVALNSKAEIDIKKIKSEPFCFTISWIGVILCQE